MTDVEKLCFVIADSWNSCFYTMMVANEGWSENYLSIWLKFLELLVKLQVVILLIGFVPVVYFKFITLDHSFFCKNMIWWISLSYSRSNEYVTHDSSPRNVFNTLHPSIGYTCRWCSDFQVEFRLQSLIFLLAITLKTNRWLYINKHFFLGHNCRFGFRNITGTLCDLFVLDCIPGAYIPNMLQGKE